MIAQTNLATVEELTSSGRMLLIQDLAVRRAINDLMLSHAEANKQASQHQDAVTTIMNSKWARWAYMAPAGEGALGGDETFDTPYRYGMVIDWAEVALDDEAANVISLMTAWCRHNLGYQDAHLRATLRLLELLRERVR